ncbi:MULTISPECIES: Spo0B C-terminal domain-containing protein [unclassified Bacillus cereus group]|uniref:Spo0B C-terminal domain-containing protein n=1 Tax=unclassified Bacillus cereus group TaxID=2750818 RepID=UPI001F5A4954|nr:MULTISPECIES: Spo0B C-terminal domain-containing protein [unclassified Bacillus cereus group]
MSKNSTVLDALRHSRHDWLNRLQLIKIHVSMGDVHRIDGLIREFVAEANHESHLMNLKMPQFSEFILTYNWCSNPFKLSFEVLGDNKDISYLDEKLLYWTKELLSILHVSIDMYVENHMCITIQILEKNSFFFDYRGRIQNFYAIQQYLEMNNDFSITYQINEDELCISLEEK